MIILEGIRRSGKTYTTDFVKDNFPFYIVYKDEGMSIIKNTPIDIDDYVIGRDLAYAQFVKTLPEKAINRLFLDRQYFTSYVYGQFYRNKYDKQFWADHIQRVESQYGDDFIKKFMSVLFIEMTEDDLKHAAKTARYKDELESDFIDDYKRQYELYQEVLEITKLPVHRMRAFQNNAYLTDFFTALWKKTHVPADM